MKQEEPRRSSAELRQDVARTRAELDSTVDAIQKRMTAAGMFEEGWNLLRRGSVEPYSASGLRMVREHPIPVAMLGLGFGWLAAETAGRSSRPPQAPPPLEGGSGESSSLGEAASEAGGRVAEMAREVGEKTSQASERVSEMAHDAGEGVSRLGGRARHRAEALGGSVRHGTRQAGRGFSRAIESNPMGAGLAAFALAVAAGTLVPATRWEDETLGETRDDLMGDAEEAGRETLEDLGEVASAAAGEAREVAQRKGLAPEPPEPSRYESPRERYESPRETTPERPRERRPGVPHEPPPRES